MNRTHQDVIDYVKRCLEHAPPERPGSRAAGLLGWDTAAGFLCGTCSSRMIDRGCHLPVPSEPVWAPAVPSGPCVGCGVRP